MSASRGHATPSSNPETPRAAIFTGRLSDGVAALFGAYLRERSASLALCALCVHTDKAAEHAPAPLLSLSHTLSPSYRQTHRPASDLSLWRFPLTFVSLNYLTSPSCFPSL
ncbi:hypothetical protein NP493_963g00072 [Ridgeia piscesae]|uniref:Uncharacterized protein n=1 Tax=Ridgeia piscesae TaxID=27915 RepID=A0AAD9KJP1_RIDPI|nr:hypothetical protein NP493_963g00072 [Ridgeia piscesae]